MNNTFFSFYELFKWSDRYNECKKLIHSANTVITKYNHNIVIYSDILNIQRFKLKDSFNMNLSCDTSSPFTNINISQKKTWRKSLLKKYQGHNYHFTEPILNTTIFIESDKQKISYNNEKSTFEDILLNTVNSNIMKMIIHFNIYMIDDFFESYQKILNNTSIYILNTTKEIENIISVENYKLLQSFYLAQKLLN
jgi:hypothetical protein